MLIVLYAFLSVGILGGLFGAGLAYASKIFAVRKDEKVAALEAALPGLNCGACGFAGCAGYAEALAAGNSPIDLCAPGGDDSLNAIADLTGAERIEGKVKMVAQVHCRGNQERAKSQFDYVGLEDCNAAHMYFGGEKTCPHGCLALGSCMRVCPVDAIGYDDEGLVWVDKEACISCEKCLDICPTGVISMVPFDAPQIVACNSTDKGAVTKKYCSVGCIGCKICAKKSPEGGFEMRISLARIDFSSMGEREEAKTACPPKCIIDTGKKMLKGVKPA